MPDRNGGMFKETYFNRVVLPLASALIIGNLALFSLGTKPVHDLLHSFYDKMERLHLKIHN